MYDYWSVVNLFTDARPIALDFNRAGSSIKERRTITPGVDFPSGPRADSNRGIRMQETKRAISSSDHQSNFMRPLEVQEIIIFIPPTFAARDNDFVLLLLFALVLRNSPQQLLELCLSYLRP